MRLLSPQRRSRVFEQVVAHASAGYRSAGRAAHTFARSKLRYDPVYRAVWESGLLPREGTLLDLGCGGGLMLALMSSTQIVMADRAGVPASPTLRLIGVETRTRVVAIARRALEGRAEVITADVRDRPLPPARTVLLFDVLNMMPAADQDALLAAVLNALEPGGTLFIREADAGAGWRFQSVNIANRLKAWWLGTSSRGFCFRTLAEWRGWLERAGLEVETRPMGAGTPFGNVLLIARRRG